MEMLYMLVDRTLIFMVWMESHIKVWGGVGRGDALCHSKSEVDIMVSSLFYPHNGYIDTEK